MAKDRNTYAKRQREVERKRKADEKRERRAKKKQQPDELCEGQSPSLLTPAEHSVLNVFRKFLMTPGKMLCFGSSDLEAFKMPLAELTSKGLLVEEKPRGGYSLTRTGFAAMKDGE